MLKALRILQKIKLFNPFNPAYPELPWTWDFFLWKHIRKLWNKGIVPTNFWIILKIMCKSALARSFPGGQFQIEATWKQSDNQLQLQ